MATTMRAGFVEVFRTQSLLGYLREFVNSPKKGVVANKEPPRSLITNASRRGPMLSKETNCASGSICYIGFSLPAGLPANWSSGSHAAEFIICELEANISTLWVFFSMQFRNPAPDFPESVNQP